MWLSELTLQLIGFRFLGLLLIVGVHGGALAGTAALLGDNGPKYDGRLTLSPLAHLDLVGTASMILFGLGWSKPLDAESEQPKTGRAGVIVVILAGFVSLLVLAASLGALILPTLTTLSGTAGLAAAAFLRVASSLAIWAALLSLAPVPPLAGGLVLGALGLRIARPVRQGLVAAVFLAVASGLAGKLLGPAHATLTSAILGG